MADTTYQPVIYNKQGGNEQIIADGGKQTHESGSELEFQSGAIIDFQSGFSFYAGSSSYTGGLTDIKQSLYDNLRVSTYELASVSATVFSPSQLMTTPKYIRISMGSNAVAEQLWFQSAPSVGQEQIIRIIPGSVASGYVTISCSTGVSLVTLAGLDNSRMILYNSTNSYGLVHIVCFEEGEWTVVGINAATSVTFT